MATTYKVLGQSSPAANTDTNLYTVPALTSTVCSTLSICNRANATTCRVSVRPAGASIANQHYIIYDTTVDPNDTLFFTLGITLSTTDVITISSGSGNVSFSLFGSELG
jgi:hypothetical protein